MNDEKKLERRIAEIEGIAKNDASVDAPMLLGDALEQASQVAADKRSHRGAYWISILLPPLGLLCALYYLFAKKPDGKKVAMYCVLLTIIALGITWYAGQVLLSAMGSDASTAAQLEQLQAMDIEDIRSLIE